MFTVFEHFAGLPDGVHVSPLGNEHDMPAGNAGHLNCTDWGAPLVTVAVAVIGGGEPPAGVDPDVGTTVIWKL